MPLAAEDILQKLVEAMDEAKSTIRELHEARGAANDIIKKQKKEIADLILTEVGVTVNTLTLDIRETMIDKAETIMLRIEQDWRSKLGLSE